MPESRGRTSTGEFQRIHGMLFGTFSLYLSFGAGGSGMSRALLPAFVVSALVTIAICPATWATPAPVPRKTLTAFASEEELAATLNAWAEEFRSRPDKGIILHSSAGSAPLPPAAAEPAPAPSNASIDYASVVKVHGDYLVILQRGRLFTIRIADGDLRPVSAVAVFAADGDRRRPIPDTELHYSPRDEMHILGNTIVVMGYSSRADGMELGMFEISAAGQLSYKGRYYVRASPDPSTSRVVGTQLVLYSPLHLFLSEDRNPLESFPAIRKWQPSGESRARRIAPATRIYRLPGRLDPVAGITLHSLTSCDLTQRQLACESTVVMGGPGQVLQMSPRALYVWASASQRGDSGEAADSTVFRMPLDHSAPTALKVTGAPIGRSSSLEGEDGILNVLLQSGGRDGWIIRPEGNWGSIALLRASIANFSDGTESAPPTTYQALPRPSGHAFYNAYVGPYLLYGASSWSPPGDPPTPSQLLAVRYASDGEPFVVPLVHGVAHVAALGTGAVFVGHDGKGFHLTTLRLDATPTVVSQYAYPATGLSNGYFSHPEGEDRELIGLPFVEFRESASTDVRKAFATLSLLRSRDLHLEELGRLDARMDEAAQDDECLAFCTNRYRNARPLFVQGRVFALLGYEIVEGAVREDRIVETRRVRFAPGEASWTLRSDTPQNAGALVTELRSGNRDRKYEAAWKLVNLGVPGIQVLARLQRMGAGLDMCRHGRGETSAPDAQIRTLLAEGKNAVVEALLESCVAAGSDDAAQDYAAFLALGNRLDAKIAELRPEVERRDDEQAAALLSYLYRAKGDYVNARWAAEQTENYPLLHPLLAMLGDWKALARLQQERARLYELEGLVRLAMSQRLAGDMAAFEKSVVALRAIADLPLAERDPEKDERVLRHIEEVATGLLLLQRPREALELLERWHPPLAAEVLAAQWRYREAFEVLERSRTTHSRIAKAVEPLRAHLLNRLGEKAEALAIVARQTAETRNGPHPEHLAGLVRFEDLLGFQDLALAHASELIARGMDARELSRLIYDLFPGAGGGAELWWAFLRSRSGTEDPGTVLQRIRDILSGALPPAELAGLLRAAETADMDDVLKREERDPDAWLRTLAEVAHAAGDDQRAQGYLEKAGAVSRTEEAYLQQGDLAAERQQWTRAAEAYRRAWEKNPDRLIALFRQGWALAQAGDVTTGRHLMDLAHWLPLGDARLRGKLVDDLEARNHAEEARREFELRLRAAGGVAWPGRGLFRYAAQQAAKRQDYLQAAADMERSVLEAGEFLRFFDSLNFAANLTAPSPIYHYRVRGLLQAGKIDEALQEVERGLTVLPGDASLAIPAVRALKARGRAAEADDLYARVRARYAEVAAHYPRSTEALNALAWLAARCYRDLDEALAHAQRAVALAPKNAGYLDTLAEVHFQRGDRDEAMEVMKQAISLEPKRQYLAQQLKRFEAGDPAADVPEVDDEN